MDNNNQFNEQNQENESTRPYQNYMNQSTQDGQFSQGGQYSNNNMNTNNTYQTPGQGGYQIPMEEPISVGDWMISLLIMMIPCIGVIMMFVWAFSSTEKKSKSNFFKAQLIWALIWTVLSIVIFVIIGASAATMLSDLNYYY